LIELTKAQKGRLAIRAFKTIADALSLRGFYKPSGNSGQTLQNALKEISPEIYGSMNDPNSIEIDGLKYILDRLPKGIEKITRIVITAKEDLDGTEFEKIEPIKRRRISYKISEKEICFVITRGFSEMYDLLAHITFLNIEALKIYNRITTGELIENWIKLENDVKPESSLSGKYLDQSIWNLSILLGRSYQETKHAYQYLEKNKDEKNSNSGLFQIIYELGKRVENEFKSKVNELLISFTPSFRKMTGQHQYSRNWACAIKEKMCNLGLTNRPVHIISANMHSIVNLLYGFAAFEKDADNYNISDLYNFMHFLRDKSDKVKKFAQAYGLHEIHDISGTHIDCQIIDTYSINTCPLHGEFKIDISVLNDTKPVLLVMDYPFGTQAFEVMEELLAPSEIQSVSFKTQNICSISIMGKAGILPGKKGDIMLATAHVLEGTPHNYLVNNDLKKDDFEDKVDIFVGPIITVLGTSLQNKDVLEKFQLTNWKAIGLEMEGGHYQRAINAALIKGHISNDVKIRYAYYASDNPLITSQTLASGNLGDEGIYSTYHITKVILEKILNRSSLEINNVCP